MSMQPRNRNLLAGRAPLIALLVTAALALVAFLVRQSAEGEHARAEKNVAAVEAMAALDARDQDVADTRSSIQQLQTKIDAANAAGPTLATTAVSYRDQLGTGLATVDQLLATARQMATIRSQQVDAATTGDYATFNALEAQYTNLAAAWDGGRAGYIALLQKLPQVSYDDLSGNLPSGIAAPTAQTAPVQTVLAPPTGPAQVNGALPDVIPCDPTGSGCTWDWEITWTETNMLGAEIQSIGREYIDRSGRIWISENGEWFDQSVSIGSGGTGTFSSWVRTAPDETPNLDGGTLIVEWQGVDAEGNAFSGSVQARLQPRSEVG